MELNNIIFHEVITEQHKAAVQVKPRDKCLDLPDVRANNLIESVLGSYDKEASLAYAGFIADSFFPNKLDKLLSKQDDFYLFSLNVLHHLRSEMGKVPASTGGYLTISQYQSDEEVKVLIILLKDKEGIGISKNLELEDVHSLNLDKLHAAALINITRWKSKQERYISFLKGKSRDREVVGYFKSLLSIDEDMYTDPAKHTKDLVTVIKNYCTDKVSEVEAGNIKNRVHLFSIDRADKNETVLLTEIASLVNPENPQEFIDYIKEQKFEIPGEFKPVAKRLKKLVSYRVKGETTNYTLSFEHSAVEDNKIWINKEEHIVISDVPQWLKDAIPQK
ncbi:nucleoid-associated protein [Photobacterium damselae]|uniref:nucleoid-associated protein n=1 Tax=Photobacterium damselae TaxID=38293 RepID=UPI000D986AA5|nr:nucleoid-associated protein [Photobacterium damselae]NVO74243.1 nucleoid-associated protein [Photobacterium damselae subsp. damselae]SPY24323.1 Nucleoid-associated protein YejK [Photobacterium damselae]